MRKGGLLLLLLLAAAPAAAQNLPDLPDLGDLPPSSRYLAGYVSFGVGRSVPVSGHWGDGTVGFKSSGALQLSAAKRVDETLSYGLETSYAGNYVNRSMPGLSLKVISLTPFVKISVPQGNLGYYGLLGAGVYQWKQPAFTSGGIAFASDAGSSLGLNLGGGIDFPFMFGTRGGLELRWHHIFDLKGNNMDLGSAENFNLSFTLTYAVWKDRKKDVSTP